MRGWSRYGLAVVLLIVLVLILPNAESFNRFAIYSANTGTYDIEDFFEVVPTTGSIDPEFGGVILTVMENANIRVREEIVQEPGFKNYYQRKYKIKNIDRNWKANMSIFSDIDPPLGTQGTYIVPAFVDLNGDDKLDIVIGGNLGPYSSLFFYKNIGSTTSPYFEGEEEDIMVISQTPTPRPTFVDIDDDGDYDLLAGEGSDGYFYENTGDKYNAQWTYRGETEFGYFVDIDADGDYDKVSPGLVLYENIGNKTHASWQLLNNTFFENVSGSSPLSFGDLDMDGDFDLVMRSGSKIVFFKNTGNSTNAKFEEDLEQMHLSVVNSNNPWDATYPTLADLDGDGDPDLITGGTKAWGTLETKFPILNYFENRQGEGGAKLEDVKFFKFIDSGGSFNEAEDYFSGGKIIYSDTLTDRYTVGGSVGMLYYSTYTYIHTYYIFMEGSPNLDNNNSGSAPSALQFNFGELDVGEEKELVITVMDQVANFTRQPLSDLIVSSISLSKTSPVGISGVISNIGGMSANYIELQLVDSYEGEVIKTKNIYLNETQGTSNTSIAPGESAAFSTQWDLDVGHTLKVIIDPANKVRESDETNNVGEEVLYKSNVYIAADVQPSNLNLIFEEYVASKLEHYNVVDSESDADYVIHIGDNPYNTIQFPYIFGKRNGHVVMGIYEGTDYYNGFVKYQYFSGKKRVFVQGVELDGVIAAAREINFNALERNNKFLGHDYKDAIAIFDFLRLAENKPYIYTVGIEFEDIVRKALYGKFKEEEKVVMTLQQSTRLRLKHLIPQQSSLFLEYSNVSDLPVMMSGGLWSDIDAWSELGGELADEGRDVWLAEITGGPWSDCDTCPDYSYTDLVDDHWPTLAAGILHFTGKSQLQFVGHSNAGRVALDSLSNWSSGKDPAGFYNESGTWNWTDMPLPADPVETFVGVGVPGAFEGSSPTKTTMLNYGWESIQELENDGKTHITLTEATVSGTFLKDIIDSKNSNKISLNLFKQYFDWMNSTDDTQPASGLELDNFVIIGGNLCIGNDCVVTINDQDAIYENIVLKTPVGSNISSKKYFKILSRHTKLPESGLVKSISKKTLNKLPLGFFDNIWLEKSETKT